MAKLEEVTYYTIHSVKGRPTALFAQVVTDEGMSVVRWDATDRRFVEDIGFLDFIVGYEGLDTRAISEREAGRIASNFGTALKGLLQAAGVDS